MIPRALIVSHLHAFAGLVPRALLDEVTEQTVETIESLELLGGGGGSDLEYAVALAETRQLPSALRKRLEARILRAIPEVVVTDSARWGSTASPRSARCARRARLARVSSNPR